MYRKTALLAIFIMIVLTSVCFAATKSDEKNKVMVSSVHEYALVDKLYVNNGEEKYKEYKKLNGYPGQHLFQVYFQDNSHDNITAFHVTYEDLRGINLYEYIYFDLNGTPSKITRKRLYEIFSKFEDHRSDAYFTETFPEIYKEFMLGLVFTDDATRLVERYFEYKNNTHQGYIKGDIKFEFNDAKDPDATNIDGMVRH